MTPTPRAVSHFGVAALEARAVASTTPPRHLSPARPLSPARSESRPRRTVVRLWLPLTAIFLLLAPFAILLSPLLYLAPPAYGFRPLAAVLAVGRLLLSLAGAVVEVDTPEALVRIRVF